GGCAGAPLSPSDAAAPPTPPAPSPAPPVGSEALKNWSNENPPVCCGAGDGGGASGGAGGGGSWTSGGGAGAEFGGPSCPNTWSSEILSAAGRVASPGDTTVWARAGSGSE